MGFQVRGLQRGELDAALGCFQAAFAIDDASIAVVRNSLVNDPYFLPERVRVGLLDGNVISLVVILHRGAYVASEMISVAGITGVATHPAFQGRGFGTRVMQDAIRLIRQRGYHLCLLTTSVPGFFLRFGFREVPKFNGYECPATALARLSVAEPCEIKKLDYAGVWPALAAVYSQYSRGRMGMQIRDMRFWETWPRRGTFPYGFSQSLDATGLVGVSRGQIVAYLAAHCPPEGRELLVTDLAHLPGHVQAGVVLLSNAAQGSISAGGQRVIIQLGGDAPIVKLLESERVPLNVEAGPGLMVLFPDRDWLPSVGLRNTDEATEHLFRSQTPVLWTRDGF